LVGLFQLGIHGKQMLMRSFQRALPILDNRTLDNLVAQSAKPPAGIWGSINHARQAQAVQMMLGEEPVSRRRPFNGRNQAPLHVAADGVRVNPHSAGKVGSAKEFRSHCSTESVSLRFGIETSVFCCVETSAFQNKKPCQKI
jgi:hypothetical protein